MTQTTLAPSRTRSPKSVVKDGRLLIQENTCVFNVTFGYSTSSRKLDPDQFEVDADEEVTSATKRLLDCSETRAIGQIDSRVKGYLSKRALPAPFKRGLYLMPIILLPEVETQMAKFYDLRQEAVRAFCAVYGERIEDDKRRLRGVFDNGDYPPVEIVQRLYTFTWQYMQIAVPTDLPPEIQERERQKLQDLWAEAAADVQVLLRANLQDLVTKLVEKVQPSEEGKRKKQIRDSFVNNVNEFLATFDARNVTNDVELAKLVGQCRTLLKGVDATSLKSDEVLRARVQRDFGEISTSLSAMLADVPKRRGFFAEEA